MPGSQKQKTPFTKNLSTKFIICKLSMTVFCHPFVIKAHLYVLDHKMGLTTSKPVSRTNVKQQL